MILTDGRWLIHGFAKPLRQRRQVRTIGAGAFERLALTRILWHPMSLPTTGEVSERTWTKSSSLAALTVPGRRRPRNCSCRRALMIEKAGP